MIYQNYIMENKHNNTLLKYHPKIKLTDISQTGWQAQLSNF